MPSSTAAACALAAAAFGLAGCGGGGRAAQAPAREKPADDDFERRFGRLDLPDLDAAPPRTGAVSDADRVPALTGGRLGGAGSPPRPAPAIHAKVLAVDNTVNLVMLSVGTGDGVRKGDVFTVFRGRKYIGQAMVEKVFPDMCSARVVASSQAAAVKEGDLADTRTR